MKDWIVTIRDHHEAYVSWEQYIQNQEALERNRTTGETMVLGGSAREGSALLQGLLLGGECGRRLTPHYSAGNGNHPIYQCKWQQREGLSQTSCMSLTGRMIDDAIAKRVLEVIRPEEINIALNAVNQVSQRHSVVSKQWSLRIERAMYEAQLAQKRYEEVDPSNRLVAATLERRWNESLQNVEAEKQRAAECNTGTPFTLSAEQKEQITSLAKDLPKLWHSEHTRIQDRKRILRLLVLDITVERHHGQSEALLHIRWSGGATEDLKVMLPSAADQQRYPAATVERIRFLAKSMADQEICAALTADNIPTSSRRPFTQAIIKHIRYTHNIPIMTSKTTHELTVDEVMEKFGVSRGVVYYWINREHVQARRERSIGPYLITLDGNTEITLKDWVSNSSRITKKKSSTGSKIKPAGDAL
jgi:hypothetical protein